MQYYTVGYILGKRVPKNEHYEAKTFESFRNLSSPPLSSSAHLLKQNKTKKTVEKQSSLKENKIRKHLHLNNKTKSVGSFLFRPINVSAWVAI